MKYVFLTFTLDGVTGGQRYVNNKTQWLQERGWEVIVFDHRGDLSIKENVVLDNLKPYKNNRFYELFFPPSYFSKKQRDSFIEKMCAIIGESDDYVVESNSSRLSFWGELLAERLHAKHIILDVNEHPDIRSKEEFEYYNYKFDRNEFYLISSKIVKSLFEGYRQISDEEAEGHMYSAIMNVIPQPIPMHEIDNLPEADYKILSFGRVKPYFDTLFDGIIKFASKYPQKKINFIIMGVDTLDNRYMEMMDSCANLYYKLLPLMVVVPKAVFEYSDVVIATAGCANISFREGAKTISMNVETNQPLGVMGYTTINSVVNTNHEKNTTDLPSLIEEILIERKYEGDYTLQRPPSKHGYDFQVSLVNNDRQYYKGVDKIARDFFIRRCVEIVLLRSNCMNVLVKMYNLFLKSNELSCLYSAS